MARDWIAYAPTAELLRESVRVTKRMQRLALPTATKTPVKRMTSPGRLITRNAVQAAALRAQGNTRAAMKVPMFRGHHIDRAARPPGVVAIMADVSSSMRWSTTAVGEAAWLLARGAAHSGARVASVVFGEGVDPIVFPGEVPQMVLVRSATDFAHNPDRALAALDGALGLSTPTTAGVPTSRIVVILSDLQWGDERLPFIARARALMTLGVRFVVLGVLPGVLDATGHVRVDQRIAEDIVDRLGVHVPIDPQILQPGSPQRLALFSDIHRAIDRHGAAAFVTCRPAPLAGTEIHQARAAGLRRLEPMSVIPRDMLNVRSVHGPSDARAVRTHIVDHTLRMLEGME